MATACSFLCEDQLLCSICLEVFTDPVATPCGHNFCKTCIMQHWDTDGKSLCPVCKKPLNARPELHVNILISEVAAQFRKSVQKKERSCSERQEAKAGEVQCDVCTETKLKALKSCLVCLTSYCEVHLERHQKVSGGTKHVLTDPVDTGAIKHSLIDPAENLEGRMCKKHKRPLELFCKTDKISICQSCAESNLHGLGHNVVPLIKEYEGKKSEVETMLENIRKMIDERRLKIEQIQKSVKLSKEDADKVTTASVEACKALIASVEAGLAQFTEIVEERQKTTEKQAESLIKVLDKETSMLKKRQFEVSLLYCTEDHLDFLQRFSSLSPLPPTEDWTDVSICSLHTRTMEEAVTNLMETVSEETDKLLNIIELKRIQKYAVDVTLDPETAHLALILSDDGKQIRQGDALQNFSNSSKRFSNYGALGEQGFSSGKFYFEVQVGEKTNWVLGVAREFVNRNSFTMTTRNGFWVLRLDDEQGYEVAGSNKFSRKKVTPKPQKVGVFVSYEDGLVSFYDVDAPRLIHSFSSCSFIEKLYPFFSPGENSWKNLAPLIICPVSKT